MNHVEDAQQVLFPCDEDLLLKGLPPERGIVGKRQLQRRFEGYEHNHEIHSVAPVLDILGVVLTSQFIHMLSHALDMILQIALLLLGRLGIDILLVSHKRDLRVDDGILSLRIVQDHVGLHLLTSLVILQRASQFVTQPRLYLIVDTFRQSLTGQQVAKDDLTHITTHLVVTAQHVRQALCLLAQLLRLLHHLQHLLTERSRVSRTFLLVLTDRFLHIRDGLLQRLCNTRHRLRILFFQFRGTRLHQLLGHVLKAFLVAFQFFIHLLAHQFQLPSLRLRTGVKLFVLRLQMVHPAGSSTQLLVAHRQFDILLACYEVHGIHAFIHQQVDSDATYRHTY